MLIFFAVVSAAHAGPLYSLSPINQFDGQADRLRNGANGVVYGATLSSGGRFFALDENRHGLVVGTGGSRAVLYNPVTDSIIETFHPFDINPGYSINDNGDVLVAGYSPSGATSGPFLVYPANHGLPIDLPINSYRRPSINNNLDAVGADVTDGSFLFIYSSGITYDLVSIIIDAPSAIDYIEPTDIDDDGRIVGLAHYIGYRGLQAILLAPLTVPEPGGIFLIIGTIAFAIYSRKKVPSRL